MHELRVMAAVELHLNATYAQHPTFKSAYEKKPIRNSFPPIRQCLN